MADEISLGGRTLVGVENADAGEVNGETAFQFEQEGERIYTLGRDCLNNHCRRPGGLRGGTVPQTWQY